MKYRKLIGLLALAAVNVILTMNLVTSARFTSTTISKDNLIKAGELNISVPNSVTDLFTLKGNIYPGWTESQPVIITNSGTLNLKYKVRLDKTNLSGSPLYGDLMISINGSVPVSVNHFEEISLGEIDANSSKNAVGAFNISLSLPSTVTNDVNYKGHETINLPFVFTAVQVNSPMIAKDDEDDNAVDAQSNIIVNPKAKVDETHSNTITDAINKVAVGGTINISPGNYSEKVVIDKPVSIIGAGSDSDSSKNTIINNGTDIVVTLAANSIQIKNIRIQPFHNCGINAENVSDIKLENVKIIGTKGIVNTNSTMYNECEYGLKVDNKFNVSNLEVIGCNFDHLTYGWYFLKDLSDETSNVSNIRVLNTSFSNNDFKGIYVEKLSNVVFENCNVSNNGASIQKYIYVLNAGFDITLKAGNYKNIKLNNMTFTNNGLYVKEGAALMIKARGTGNDDFQYTTFPATLDGVSITGGTFTGNERGIRLGEIGKNNVGPTNVTITGAAFNDNIQRYSGNDGSKYGDIIDWRNN